MTSSPPYVFETPADRPIEPQRSSACQAHRAKIVLRTALALVWIHEGLIPKLLFPMARELDLVASTGLYWPAPRATLGALGVVEMICGLWLLTGRGERVAAVISTFVLIGLTPLMVSLNPAVLYHPYGGVSKNLGRIACGVAIWMLSRGEHAALAPIRAGRFTVESVMSQRISRGDTLNAQSLSRLQRTRSQRSRSSAPSFTPAASMRQTARVSSSRSESASASAPRCRGQSSACCFCYSPADSRLTDAPPLSNGPTSASAPWPSA